VIEKTASFVSTSGVQMEIVLKTKQSNNPQFAFLKYDHYLNPYYRHLITMIKSGKYRPNVDNNSTNNSNQKKKSSKNGLDQSSSHDEDESSDSYLHPLLRGGSNNDNTNQITQRKVVPKLTIRVRPDPMLLDDLGKMNSSKSSLVTIKVDNGKRSLIEASSLRSTKRRKT